MDKSIKILGNLQPPFLYYQKITFRQMTNKQNSISKCNKNKIFILIVFEFQIKIPSFASKYGHGYITYL